MTGATQPQQDEPAVETPTAGPESQDSAPAAESVPQAQEPISVEPAPSEPAPSDPAQAEPAQADPAPSEPAQADPAQAEPAQAEPTQADSEPSEPVQADPTPTEPVQAEPAPVESTPVESASAEPAIVDDIPAEKASVDPSPPEPSTAEEAPAEPATITEPIPQDAPTVEANTSGAAPEATECELVEQIPAPEPVAEVVQATQVQAAPTATDAPQPEAVNATQPIQSVQPVQQVQPQQQVVQYQQPDELTQYNQEQPTQYQAPQASSFQTPMPKQYQQPAQYQAQPAQYQAQPAQYQAQPAQYQSQPAQYQHQSVQFQPQPVMYQQQQQQQQGGRQRRQRPVSHEVPAVSQVVQGQASVPTAAGGPVAVLRSSVQASNESPAVVYGGTIKSVSIQPDAPQERKGYQTYDMSGGKFYQPATQHVQYQNQNQNQYQFDTARSRPFVEQPRQAIPQPIPQPVQQQPPPPPVQQTPVQGYGYQHVEPPARDYYEEDSQLTQSRTFKVLQSLMSSDEPHSGVQGLPKQRSKSQEQWKAEQDAKRGQGRVKVFMPQQYNSPLGMYSAKNVVETFQAQAETVMETMDRPTAEQYANMSAVQRALMDG